MRDEINDIKSEATARILKANSKNELENIRIDYLGRSGKLNKLTREVKNLNLDKKKEIGILINLVKSTIQSLLVEQKIKLKEKF